jgi:hypothetical protein
MQMAFIFVAMQEIVWILRMTRNWGESAEAPIGGCLNPSSSLLDIGCMLYKWFQALEIS